MKTLVEVMLDNGLLSNVSKNFILQRLLNKMLLPKEKSFICSN